DRPSAGDGGLAQATSAEDVAAALARAAVAYGRESLVFAARRDRFVGKESGTASLRALARALTVPAGGPSVLATASKSGPYLGPLPTTPVHRGLAEALGDPDDDVAVVGVSVGGRAALVLVIAGMPLPAQAMEHAERLASLAAARLEAILRQRRP
ncbi:MAG: hypothetical protein FJ104_05740, partial [Deltaproteobacteria bacterium]|nr:hypothetical protein [Deltaproteobacteria bacterium]